MMWSVVWFCIGLLVGGFVMHNPEYIDQAGQFLQLLATEVEKR